MATVTTVNRSPTDRPAHHGRRSVRAVQASRRALRRAAAARPHGAAQEPRRVRAPARSSSRSCSCSCSSTCSRRSARASAAAAARPASRRSRPCSSPAWSASSIMFQGIQAVALPLVAGVRLHPRDRGPRAGAAARCGSSRWPRWSSGALQGVLAALIVFPIAAVVPRQRRRRAPARSTG